MPLNRFAYALLIAAPLTWAADRPTAGRLAYLQFSFQSDAGLVRANACLAVIERSYPESASWRGFGSPDETEKPVEAVLSAFKRKDREALFQLSDPKLGRDPKQFAPQADAYFKQFESIETAGIPLAYEFGGLIAFFGRFRSADRTFFAPLIFHRESDGSFGFLPYRTEDPAFQLIQEWFFAPWGPANAATASFCPPSGMGSFTHRVLISQPGVPPAAHLYLKGAPIESPGPLAGISAAVKSAISEIKRSLIAENWIETLPHHLSPEGGRHLKEWLNKANAKDRAQYQKAIAEQEPFFIFYADPLVVVYTKSPAGNVQTMYFTVSADNHLTWTNTSLVTASDKIFKSGALYSAARLDRPFSSLEIK